MTLNKEKCEFRKTELVFLGHVINQEGISPDPLKTEAILKMDRPTTVTELRRFLGMINQFGKFTPNIAEMSKPLRGLLSKKQSWTWGPFQDDAFQKLKGEILKPTVLAVYDVSADTKISADASAYGLGAVLLQRQPGKDWRPIAFASRTMTETEQRYSQIEKESLALVWACEKFSDYVIGKQITLETDHKPLVPLLGRASLCNLPPRILRFRLRLTRFQYSIVHVPGKQLYTADTLSRAPLEVKHQVEETCLIHALINTLPAGQSRLEEYCNAQQQDTVCSKLRNFCEKGWPSKHQVKGELSKYWQQKSRITIVEDLVLYGSRIIVPETLRQDTLRKIHSGHQGIQKCHQRITTSVWWPGVTKDMEQLIKKCPECVKSMTVPREPLLPSPLPQFPWEKIASDLFEYKGKNYLLVVDYFSRFVEVQRLHSTTSSAIITALKAIFARYGVPAFLVSDNGPQYVSQEMKDFASKYGFVQVTSSPHYPRSNGLAERTVRTVKALFSKSKDLYLCLLAYRAIPLPWCGLSPAELLMGRRIRTDVPQVTKLFVPEWSYLKDFHKKDHLFKQQQKKHYDKRHRVRDLSPIPDDTETWVNTRGTQAYGTVRQADVAPRSYWVDTPSGCVRRNRQDIIVRPPEQPTSSETSEQLYSTNSSSSQPNVIATRSRTGTQIRPPERLTY